MCSMGWLRTRVWEYRLECLTSFNGWNSSSKRNARLLSQSYDTTWEEKYVFNDHASGERVSQIWFVAVQHIFRTLMTAKASLLLNGRWPLGGNPIWRGSHFSAGVEAKPYEGSCQTNARLKSVPLGWWREKKGTGHAYLATVRAETLRESLKSWGGTTGLLSVAKAQEHVVLYLCTLYQDYSDFDPGPLIPYTGWLQVCRGTVERMHVNWMLAASFGAMGIGEMKPTAEHNLMGRQCLGRKQFGDRMGTGYHICRLMYANQQGNKDILTMNAGEVTH